MAEEYESGIIEGWTDKQGYPLDAKAAWLCSAYELSILSFPALREIRDLTDAARIVVLAGIEADPGELANKALRVREYLMDQALQVAIRDLDDPKIHFLDTKKPLV